MGKLKFFTLFAVLISFFQVYAEDYYWVGGQGDWSDLNSWRTISGTIPNEVPDASDNVIFNQNSFVNDYDTIFIYTGNPTCNNLTFTNISDTVVIVGGNPNSAFSIYGSITFHPKVINNYMGKILFSSELTGNTITCAGARFPGDIWFDGTGEWILQDTLFVLDTIPADWESVIYYFEEPDAQDPVIVHNNGTFNANGQTIITRGFQTTGNKPRSCFIQNSDILMVGNWILGAENLTFNAANSYILIGGSIDNSSGELINYHDIDVMPVDGSIKNTDIRTYMRKVHFLGGGSVDGKKTPGIEGSFVIDTLIMEGAWTMAGPIPNEISAVNSIFHYTQINGTMGYVETKISDFHRIDYNCVIPSYLKGYENVIDSIHFFVPDGALAGDNIVNNLLLFNTLGSLSSWVGEHSTIEHAEFSSDGFITGTNTINLLTLNTGYWYQFGADSIAQPGSYQTGTHKQFINEIEVSSNDLGCNNGTTFISSIEYLSPAIIDYTGSDLTINYLSVMDMQNVGNVIHIADGADLGNNSGFDFGNLQPDARTLYWVGGHGFWSDRNHWSLSSGGPGGECPPTFLDDIFFTSGSGFDAGDTVMVNIRHAYFNDMTWEDDVQNQPFFMSIYVLVDSIFDPETSTYIYDSTNFLTDTTFMHIWGSLRLSPAMSYLYFGEVHFESQNDDEYESIYLTYRLEGEPGVYEIYQWLFNKVYFRGKGGKWRFDSKFVNYYDTTYLKMGTILLENDTMLCLNFNSEDTLNKGIFFLDSTLCEVHGYQQNAWVLNAYGATYSNDTMTDLDTNLVYNFGTSIIRSLGDISPPPGAPPGFCNIRTYAGEVKYHNIEFSTPDIGGLRSILISESKCEYNLVDYYIMFGDGVGNGIIDTLTYKPGADGCKLRNTYEVNFVYAYGVGDTMIGNHEIDTAFFFEDGAFFGYHRVGYLEANKFMHLMLMNQVDTAILKGNGAFSGSNTFDQLVLAANKRYLFQHDLEDASQFDTTRIISDLVMTGNCDGPIRIQSDSIGTSAYILYKALDPSHPEYTADYTSMRDIYMVPYNGNTYTAINSINLGHNTNWDFIESGNDIYYWVGGAGNWGDYQHWSFESGGAPIDGHCTPKEINTVIFDNNSFSTPTDTVTIDVLNAYCKNMYWKHSADFTPVFIGADTTSLFIYGSVEFSETMDYQYAGLIYFDHFEETNFVADTITSRGKIILNDIRFQGINDVVLLGDDLTLLVDAANFIFTTVWHEHGTFNLNGKHLNTGGYMSTFKNPRTLIMENSKATVLYDFERAWWIDGENFQLFADQSTIYNQSFMGTIMTENGINLKYYNIELNGPIDSLANKNNVTEYNIVSINMENSLVTGNFIADTVYLRGRLAGMYNKSTTNVVYLDSTFCSINQKHNINRCFINRYSFIRGNNNIKYCVGNDDGVFMGHNIFDTLVLYPGTGSAQGLGNWFYFQIDSTQTINDSLYIRGNQCSNINIATYPALVPNKLAYLQKDNGYDLACDFVNIYGIAAISDNIEFYAGTNSTPLPDPNNPPPGWIFENAQGYIYGFDGRTDRYCLGNEYIIDASDFNGDASTEYFWEGSPFPGDETYAVSEPGTYHIRVQYFDGCMVDDYIIIEGNYPPKATIDPGPFCEGDMIHVQVTPDNDAYKYYWSTGETTSQIVAKIEYTGGIYVQVIDTTNKCESVPNQTIIVKPTPDPETALGDDVTVKYEESIVLDAGEGDLFTWTSTPEVAIENQNAQSITVRGYKNPIEYKVNVDLDGCPAEGYKLVTMYPPSKWGVPTAFSPNDDEYNPVLYVYGSGFSQLVFRIYNRYGKLMFETTNPDASEGWDGTVNGAPQEMDVYTYYLSIVFQDGGAVEDKGNITLLR